MSFSSALKVDNTIGFTDSVAGLVATIRIEDFSDVFYEQR